MSRKILIIGSNVKSLMRFRLSMMQAFLSAGCSVVACAPVEADRGEVFEILTKNNIKFFPIVLKRNAWCNFIYDFFTIISLSRLMIREKPDVVLSYTLKPVIYGSILSKFFGAKSIYSMITGLGYVFTGDDFKRRCMRFVVKGMYILALKFNTKIFFQNPDDLGRFVSENIVSKQRAVLVNGSGVDLNYYVSKPLPKRLVFLFVGRFVRDKGLFEYLSAAREVKKKYPWVDFKLAGGFDSNPSSIARDDLERFISEGVVDNSGFLEDVRLVLERASVLVLPSYREGTPRSVLEAMAMGRPIITTDAPGCRETVVDGVNGFLVPVKNVEKIVEAMEKFILHPEMIPVMGSESRRIAEEKYDVHKVNSVILREMELCN